MVHILLKPGLENFEHYFTSVWDECNCAVVWAFFGIAFLWDWNENLPFPVLWSLLSFPNLQAYWVQHFHIVGHLRSMYWKPIVCWVQALALSSQMKKILLEVTTVGETRITQEISFGDRFERKSNWELKLWLMRAKMWAKKWYFFYLHSFA